MSYSETSDVGPKAIIGIKLPQAWRSVALWVLRGPAAVQRGGHRLLTGGRHRPRKRFVELTGERRDHPPRRFQGPARRRCGLRHGHGDRRGGPRPPRDPDLLGQRGRAAAGAGMRAHADAGAQGRRDAAGRVLESDPASLNQTLGSSFCLSMIFSENRSTLFGIMLWRLTLSCMACAGAHDLALL